VVEGWEVGYVESRCSRHWRSFVLAATDIVAALVGEGGAGAATIVGGDTGWSRVEFNNGYELIQLRQPRPQHYTDRPVKHDRIRNPQIQKPERDREHFPQLWVVGGIVFCGELRPVQWTGMIVFQLLVELAESGVHFPAFVYDF